MRVLKFLLDLHWKKIVVKTLPDLLKVLEDSRCPAAVSVGALEDLNDLATGVLEVFRVDLAVLIVAERGGPLRSLVKGYAN
jgi:hypothetical protein